MASASEEKTSEGVEELTHKTKLIQFFGRSTPIILQNDNGPCPLLAICNVLLLKNNLNLSPDIPEISQERLLSLVAERLIDSNSNVDNKDVGYVENQQQNIADAIDLLPRLTTGIDVNIKFKGITEFEFTRECAIFDLLDIPLYHGWIIDPQDNDTYNAIGSKSYNTIMGDLVGLEAGTVRCEDKKKPEEDSVDFVAATTATLGVPSPGLSRGLSFDDSTGSVSERNKARKGDLEEEAELLRAMRMSEANFPDSSNDVSLDSSAARKGDLEEEAELLRAMKLSEANFPNSSKDVCSDRSDQQNVSAISNESVNLKNFEPVAPSDTAEGIGGVEIQKSWQQEPSSNDSNDLADINNDLITFETIPEKHDCLSLENDQKISNSQLSCEEPGECNAMKDVDEKSSIDILDLREAAVSDSPESDLLSTAAISTIDSEGTKQFQDQSVSKPNVQEEDNQSAHEALNIASSTVDAELVASGDSTLNRDVYETVTPSGDITEPIYAGEECILEPGTTSYEDREPVYEGEVVIAEQADKNSKTASDVACKNEITPQQGELIKDFLKTNASQLTVYGLVRLQEELKERELCVFFRNNHFNTMFKFGGQLYLLATDQGYINQPDLVWEMLNEVNGNTVFVTGSFKEFKAEDDHVNDTWDEQNARASTAEYLASINDPAQDNSSFSSDLQLAMALQEQEFEQQPRRNTQQQNVSGGSGLVTGPQASRSSNNRYLPQPSKPVPKPSKDKCVVM